MSANDMYTYVCKDFVNGVLLPVRDLIERIAFDDVSFWRFRYIYIMGYGLPFGMRFNEFEAATRKDGLGLVVGDPEFQVFLKSDIQIVNGEIEAWSDQDNLTRIATIECDDASAWEIATDHEDVAKNLEEAGFTQL
jgi:hypothetical protein